MRLRQLNLRLGQPVTLDRAGWAEVLLIAIILTAPLELELVLTYGPTFGDPLHRVSVFLFDLPALGLLGLVAQRAFRVRWRSFGWLGIGAALLVFATVVSVVVHPSLRGVQSALRLGEMIGISAALPAVLRRNPRPVVVAVSIMLVLESVLGLMQMLHGQAGGLGLPGERGGLDTVGSSGIIAAKGTFWQRYLYAGFAMVAATGLLAADFRRNSRWLLLTLFLGGLPLGLSVGRVSLLGLLLCSPWALGAIRRRRLRSRLISWYGGAALGAALTLPAWLSRADLSQVEGSSGLDSFSSGRVALVKQAWQLFKAEPIFGVGAGRYSFALDQASGAPGKYALPVHDVPLLILAETGIVGLVGVLILLVLLARRVLHGGTVAKFIFLGYLPFLLLDLPYGLAMGTCVVGAWVGLLLYLTTPETA